MDDVMIATQLENIDRRLATVEQILPTLATKEDLRAFATKEDLGALSTKVDVLFEELRGDVRLLAGHLAEFMSRRTDR